MSRPATGPAAESLTTKQIEAQIVEIAGQLAATTCRWLLLIAEYDRRGAHVGWGFSSCSTWLAFQCSLDARSAREHVRVARRLLELPLTTEAFARGELSYSKVRALTRIAAPETEEELVELARQATANQLDGIVRDYGRCVSAAEAFDAHASRFFEWSRDERGCVVFSGKLGPEEGTALIKAIEAAECFDVGDREDPEPPRARRADALTALATTFLDSGRNDASPPTPAAEIVVHVDSEALPSDAPGRCQIENGPPLARESARRISCDAAVVPMLDGPEGPLSVGRRRRTIPPSIKRALAARDGRCQFPGCEHTRFLHGHHIEHWSRGGETSLENLVMLCSAHHRLVHEGGFSVGRGADGALCFRRPNGKPVVPQWCRGTAEIAAPSVTPEGVVPLARGERFDRELAVWGLLARARPPTPQPIDC